MPRDKTIRERQREQRDKADRALDRHAHVPTESRVFPQGATSFASKTVDPAVKKMIDEFQAKKGKPDGS